MLGDMGELGENERALHQGVGTFLSDTGIETVFCVGTLMKALAEEVKRLSPEKEVFHYETKEEMLKDLLSYVKEKDTILVKASHFMEFPKVVETLEENL